MLRFEMLRQLRFLLLGVFVLSFKVFKGVSHHLWFEAGHAGDMGLGQQLRGEFRETVLDFDLKYTSLSGGSRFGVCEFHWMIVTFIVERTEVDPKDWSFRTELTLYSLAWQ